MAYSSFGQSFPIGMAKHTTGLQLCPDPSSSQGLRGRAWNNENPQAYCLQLRATSSVNLRVLAKHGNVLGIP